MGDVHFAERVGVRLAANPATVFAQAAPGLRRPDLTMVNLETAITTGGEQQNKAFTFRAPPSALTALREAGIDLATMANNHGADFGVSGLRDSLAASSAAQFPVIGIGANAAQAYAPYRTTLGGAGSRSSRRTSGRTRPRCGCSVPGPPRPESPTRGSRS